MRAPCSVAILLDTSESTRSRLGEIKQAALRFLDALRPEDRVMMVSFDSAIYVDSEWTSDRLQLRKAALGTRTWRMTRMFDALDLVIRERLQRVRGRKKALVLLGDGIDTHSRLSNSVTTLALVEESNVVVFPVRYDTEGSWQPPTFMIRNPDESIWRRLPVAPQISAIDRTISPPLNPEPDLNPNH